MNAYFEEACRWFGPTSCETASITDLITMMITITLAVIVAIWLMGKIGVSLQRS